MTSSQRPPGPWEGLRWALQAGAAGGGTSRARLAGRAFLATLRDGKALSRWMTVVSELRSRDVVQDVPGEYLRALRPHVHRATTVRDRIVQLTDHLDWLETAFHAKALEQVTGGRDLVLAELTPPRGCDFLRLQLRRAPAQSPEGEMLLTLTLQRSPELQQKAKPIDACVLAFSRYRIDGTACLVIGGVRGPRHPLQRVSPVEIAQALQGWKPSVLLVRVAQELARYWNLNLVGLDPAAHRLHGWTYRLRKRHRETGQRIFDSYRALWEHFNATNGPAGWVIVPLESDEKLAATALSPEKRARQTRRADYWIRTRNLLRTQFRQLLQRPSMGAQLSRITHALDPAFAPRSDDDDGFDFESSEDMIPSRVLQTAPGSLI